MTEPGSAKLLLLMRHAEAVEFAPGCTDFERPLSESGRGQAERAGAYMAERGLAPELVICSAAERTSETTALLGLNCPIERSEAIYNAGSDTIRGVIETVDADVHTVLVVGHAPGIPSLAHDLADLDRSNADAAQAIHWGFPPATLVVLELDAPWAELTSGRLRLVARF